MPSVNLGTVYKSSASGQVVEDKGTSVELQDDSVVIDLTHAGLCGTDLHFRKKQPAMVLGHEPVGLVAQVGPRVTRFKVGDRVGFGYNSGACTQCNACLTGRDTQCPDKKMYGEANTHQAAFGDRAVIPEGFVHKIPEGLSLESAAPLQCGGATVYGALVNAQVKPIDRVGIIGIGGLGHLAIQYANKMGCEVTVFSSTPAKKEEAMKLGAHNFVATKETPDLTKAGIKPINHLIVTTSHLPNWKQYLPILTPYANVIPLTVDMNDFAIPNMQLIGNELRVIGSLVANRQTHRDMLEFSARHDIKPMIEKLPLTADSINKAMERLENGDVRYRFVFVNEKNVKKGNGHA